MQLYDDARAPDILQMDDAVVSRASSSGVEVRGRLALRWIRRQLIDQPDPQGVTRIDGERRSRDCAEQIAQRDFLAVKHGVEIGNAHRHVELSVD